MATELSQPCETLSVAEILNALGINHGIAAEDTQLYFVIPGRNGPRWLIPERPCASASVLSAWHPYNLSSRMKWFVLRMAARAGVLRLLPAVSSVTASRKGALRWFERCGIRSQTGEMVILAGSPSPDWKLITFLLDDAHRIAAVLKVGLTDGGGVSILHEAEVLGKLAQYSWAPRILSVHSDLRAASQEYVCGAMPGRGFRPEYMDRLCRLPQSGGCKTLAMVADEMEKRLSPFKAQLDEMAPDLLDRALSCIDLDIAVPTMLVHGDFAPWNLRKNPEAGYVLIDWEWANFAGLPAYDIFHFQFNDDRLFGEKAGGYAAIRSGAICAEYFHRMDLDLELLPRLAIAYLLDQLESHCKHRGYQHTAYTLHQLATAADELGTVSQPGVQFPKQ
jgi:hypothetical protein